VRPRGLVRALGALPIALERRIVGFQEPATGESRFKYDALAAKTSVDAKDRLGWLARDLSYTPQPYEQLASVFRAAGEPAKTQAVLYESRERARRETTWPRWFGLTLLKWTIGYGIGLGYFRALGWMGKKVKK
jgi:hypothetical protein